MEDRKRFMIHTDICGGTQEAISETVTMSNNACLRSDLFIQGNVVATS